MDCEMLGGELSMVGDDVDGEVVLDGIGDLDNAGCYSPHH
jgi:hypothetical protein